MARAANAHDAERRLRAIMEKAERLSVCLGAATQLQGVRKLVGRTGGGGGGGGSPQKAALVPLLVGVASVVVALVYSWGLLTHEAFSRAWLKWHGEDIYSEMCTIYMPDQLVKALRPPEDCSMCQGQTMVEKVANISPTHFEERFAYTGRPVVIVDAMENWTAQHEFSFEFFKELYEENSEYWSYQMNCQFFPYETEFRELREVFNMSEDRAKMTDGTKPWYIGWSNCDDRVARIVRRHYSRPYFLPDTAENKRIDWFFMGSPGYGARMHVDNVEHPSWQAQLRGQKKWILQPPPECHYECNTIEVTVEPGEIIVLDTNRWYHSTLIVSNEMSITIGAEYD